MVFSFTLALPLALCAATNYPSSGGDIATAEGWGLDEVPSGVVGFTLGVPYSASKAVTFAGMQLSGSSGTSSVFDLSSGFVTLNGNTATDLQFMSSGLTAVMKGGSFTVGKGSRIGYTSSVAGNTLTLDGCAFSHVGSKLMVGASASSGNAVVLTNGATAAISALELSNNGGNGNRFEVNAGCTVSTTGDVVSDSYGSRAEADSSLLLVRGAGASLSLASGKSVYIGWRHDNNVVTVAGGASLQLSSTGVIQFGSTGQGSSPCGHGALNVLDSASASAQSLQVGVSSSCNSVTVSNATLSVGWETAIGMNSGYGTNSLVAAGPSATVGVSRLRIAKEAGCDRNFVRVLDGATLNSPSDTRIGWSGSFNELVVSNATFNAAALSVGYDATASNNTLRIAGPSTVFTLPKDSWGDSGAQGYFGAGGGGLVEFSDGCAVTFNHAKSSVIGSLSDGNIVRVTGGAQVTEPNPVVGRPPRADSPATTGNRLEILDGATFTLVRPYVKGVGNGIVVSNATLHSSNSQVNTFVVGETFESEGDLAEATSNNFLRLEGSSPKVRAAYTGAGFRFRNRSRLEFALPAVPYAEAPLRGSQLDVDDTSDIVFDFSALDAVSHGRLKYRLFETTTANDNLKSMLSEVSLKRANERLKQRGASIAWEGSGIGSKLVCTVKGNNGMVILFR